MQRICVHHLIRRRKVAYRSEERDTRTMGRRSAFDHTRSRHQAAARLNAAGLDSRNRPSTTVSGNSPLMRTHCWKLRVPLTGAHPYQARSALKRLRRLLAQPTCQSRAS